MAGHEWRIGPGERGTRLDKWLADAARLASRRRAAVALARGQIFVNDVEQTPDDAARRLEDGDRVRLWRDRPGSAARRGGGLRGGLAIVYEDDQLLVADKPPGLLTVPLPDRPREASLQALVASHWHSHGRAPLVVHRIDRDTSGLVVFAKEPRAWRVLKEQFVRRAPERRYTALAEGAELAREGTWRSWLRWNPATLRQEVAPPRAPRALEAVTHYAVRERFAGAALLDVRLETGRRHQVRVQAWLAGHPLVGERLYRDANAPGDAVAFWRQALHASRLSFLHPVTGRPLACEAPLPDDLRRLIAMLRPADSGAAGDDRSVASGVEPAGPGEEGT